MQLEFTWGAMNPNVTMGHHFDPHVGDRIECFGLVTDVRSMSKCVQSLLKNVLRKGKAKSDGRMAALLDHSEWYSSQYLGNGSIYGPHPVRTFPDGGYWVSFGPMDKERSEMYGYSTGFYYIHRYLCVELKDITRITFEVTEVLRDGRPKMALVTSTDRIRQDPPQLDGAFHPRLRDGYYAMFGIRSGEFVNLTKEKAVRLCSRESMAKVDPSSWESQQLLKEMNRVRSSEYTACAYPARPFLIAGPCGSPPIVCLGPVNQKEWDMIDDYDLPTIQEALELDHGKKIFLVVFSANNGAATLLNYADHPEFDNVRDDISTCSTLSSYT